MVLFLFFFLSLLSTGDTAMLCTCGVGEGYRYVCAVPVVLSSMRLRACLALLSLLF